MQKCRYITNDDISIFDLIKCGILIDTKNFIGIKLLLILLWIMFLKEPPFIFFDTMIIKKSIESFMRIIQVLLHLIPDRNPNPNVSWPCQREKERVMKCK